MAPTADQVIAKAASQVGGYFPGSSPYGVWYDDKLNTKGFAKAAFCAMGLSWVFDHFSGGLDIFPLHAYTPSGVNWFRSKGQWTNGISGIRRGDVVFFDFPGAPNRVSHVAIVESVNSDGSFNTIEFNTSGTASGDQRNGRVVARKRRKSYAVGFGRPAYANSPASPSQPPAHAGYDNGNFTTTQIADAQAKLKKLGYYHGDVDGFRGPQTVNAVVAFQTANGLDPDGWPGPVTMGALNHRYSGGRKNVEGLQRAAHAAVDNNWGPDLDKRLHSIRMASKFHNYQMPNGVKFLQDALGVAQDGDYGPKSVAGHDRAVRAIQIWLRDNGYYSGAIDNSWGPATDAAFVQAWRENKNY